MAHTYCTYWESPLGTILLCSDGTALTGLYLNATDSMAGTGIADDAQPFAVVREQLTEYFVGKRTVFDLPLHLQGTAFQIRVWTELQRIPYGVTISYGELAKRLGDPKASRAVGAANGQNPISLVVPCHRVIGANGNLTGYGGGLAKKHALLDFERAVLAQGAVPFDEVFTPLSSSIREPS